MLQSRAQVAPPRLRPLSLAPHQEPLVPLPDAPTPPISLRLATTADVPALVAVIQGAFFEYLGRLDPPSGAHAESPATVLRLLRTEHALLAESAGQAVGCLFFAPNERRAPPGLREIYLHRLGVLPAFRRMGVATLLMETAERWAAEAGYDSIALGVRLALPANRHFYEARGYLVNEFTTHAGYSHATALVMRKRLGPAPATEVVVLEWTPVWADAFDQAAAALRRLIEADLLALFHVGSTAVRGLAARPTIDILGVAGNLERVEARDEVLLRAGWQPLGARGVAGGRFYRKGDESRPTHQLLLYRAGHPEIGAHLALAAFLNTHSDEAAAYGERKRSLAAAHKWDPAAYTAGKQPLLQSLRMHAQGWWQLTRSA
jgi:GrpB-like predicted nucleotidyltransferase (UPF0157 family)/GNAT superfamily N-acetyltransferase